MSILSDFEDRMASIVEGFFAGAFRSPVQPVEIAKSLAKAMDDSRAVGVGKVYVPSTYLVTLSKADTEKMGTFGDTLAGELATYLGAHAKEQGYSLAGRPRVIFRVAEDLRLGRFRVRTESADVESREAKEAGDVVGGEGSSDPEEPPSPDAALGGAAASGPAAPSPGESRLDDDEAERRARLLASVPPVRAMATVTVSGVDHDVALQGDRVTIGRLAGCEVCLQDANVSREHAEFVPESGGWAIHDLDSTNGTFVNGERVGHVRLKDGDVVRVGVSQLIYHEPRTQPW